MSSELFSYDHANKDLLMRSFANHTSAHGLNKMIKAEVRGIETRQTTPDFLELLTGQQLFDTLKEIQNSMQTLELHNKSKDTCNDVFSSRKQRSLLSFTRQLERMVDTNEKHSEVGKFIHVHRKTLGFPDSIDSLKNLTDVLLECFRKDLLGNEELFLVNYPGSFNPFPHPGHIEAASLFYSNFSNSFSQDPRVLVTTSKNSLEDKDNFGTFINRVENMHRGFFDENYTSVLGIPGDVVDKDHRISQLDTLSQFDLDRKLRFLIGSDNFIKKVRSAQKGDSYSSFLLQPDHDLFLSIRPDVEKDSLAEALELAEKEYKVKPFLLPHQKIASSGSLIRSVHDDEKSLYVQTITLCRSSHYYS